MTTPEPQEPAEVRLLLICQSEGLRNRYSGLPGYEESDDNSGLTAVGWEQTNLLAAWLRNHERIDVLISAPQLRSRLTAQRIGQALGLPVKVRADLPKYSSDKVHSPAGSVEMPRSIAALHAGEQSRRDDEYSQFCAAAVSVVDQVLQEQWGKAVAIVLNGAAVAAITRQFFGAQVLPIAVVHSGITEFNRRHGQWRLAYANRREHLPAPAIAVSQQGATAAAVASGIDPDELARVVDVYNRLAGRTGTELNDAGRVQRMRDLLRFAHLPPDLRVLDAGTGAGQLALLLAEEGAREVVGVDVSPAMLELAEYQRLARPSTATARVSYRLAPGQALPFSDEWFDAIVCRLVLQHTAKPERLLQELTRVLKPGGLFVLCDLLGADDPVRRATQNAIEERRNPSFEMARTQEQYRKLIGAAGLTIESEKVAIFERELDEWFSDMDADPTNRVVVRDMIEAGIETDASGFHARRQGMKLQFEQRMLYVRAMKKQHGT